MAPAYSVIITAYNEEEYVAGAIRSVLSQTLDDFELIVVDDGSTDGTAGVIQPFESDPRVRLISQSNMGLSAARNNAIAASSAERISFLDSDDLWLPNYLAEVDRAFASQQSVGFVYVDAWRLHDSGRFFRAPAMARQNPPDDPPRDPIEFLRLLIHDNFIFVSVTVRREAFEVVGNFNTSLTACEDYDLWIRILSHGFGAARASGRLAVKRDRENAMSRANRNMRVNMREVYRMSAELYDVPADVRAVAKKNVARLDRSIAALDGGAPALALWWSIRARLGAARRAFLRRRIWHSETPPEITEAFPDLFSRP